MDPYSFPPIAAILDGAYSVVVAIADLLEPIAGSSSAAATVLLVTIAVRACLVPVGVAQARAEVVRRRLGPELRELRRRYAKRPDVLRQKTTELYAREKASPFGGCLPALLQAPVLSIVYALFAFDRIDGHLNGLLTEQLLGVPLAASMVGTAAGGGALPQLAMFLALLVIITATALLSRRRAMRSADAAAGAPHGSGTPRGAAPTAAASTATPVPPALATTLSWAPLVTVAVAAFVPLAATIYLTATSLWTLVERWAIGRLIARPRPAG